MEKRKLPDFLGRARAVIKIPENTLRANYLMGDFGKAVLEEYTRRVNSDYHGAKALDVLSYNPKTDAVHGSNPFAIVLLNQILRPERLRTATQADLEEIIVRTRTFTPAFVNEHSSFVLRSESGHNEYFARNLGSQLRARGSEIDLPVMIPLSGLDLVNDSDNQYGLAFKLREDSEIIYAPILNEESGSKFLSEDIDIKTGLPKRILQSRSYNDDARTLNTREGGLSVVGLYEGFTVEVCSSEWGEGKLSCSEDSCLVFVVKDGVGKK